MNLKTVTRYGVAVVVGAILLRAAVAVAMGFFGFAWSLVTTIAPFLVAGAALYGGYRFFDDRVGDDEDGWDDIPTTPQERYAKDEIDEEELERELELDLE